MGRIVQTLTPTNVIWIGNTQILLQGTRGKRARLIIDAPDEVAISRDKREPGQEPLPRTQKERTRRRPPANARH